MEEEEEVMGKKDADGRLFMVCTILVKLSNLRAEMILGSISERN